MVEADRVDRYGTESLKRYKAMSGIAYLTGDQLKDAKTTLRDGLKKGFRTPTALALATKLVKEMGWIV